MNREIEEMAKTLCGQKEHSCAECDSCDLCEFWLEASILYANGYRKATDVAREIINNALAKIQIMISGIKAQEENGIVTEFNGGAKTALETVFRDISDLRKKYESEGAE